MDFETLWTQHQRKVTQKMKTKKALQLAIVSTLVVGVSFTASSFATNLMAQRDNVDYAFESDLSLVGTWEPVDFIEKIEDFDPVALAAAPEDVSTFAFEKLAFTSNGESKVSIEGGALAPAGFSFTKGHILHHGDQTDAAYTIKVVGSDEYLFMQWKSGDYTYRFQEPYYYVLKRLDTVDHINTVAVNLKNDDTDLPFALDEAVLGQWKSVGFCKTVEDFDPLQPSTGQELSLLGAEFKEDGKIVANNKGNSFYNDKYKWTQGKVISPSEKTVANYYTKEFNGKTYLFFPWISGDVLFRNMEPCFYVMEKVQ